MTWSRHLHSALTPLRLTLAIALAAVASSGYVVVVAAAGTPTSLELALARPAQPSACHDSDAGPRGRVSFATAAR